MNVIEVNGLKKQFGEVKAIDGISFGVEEGEVFGFLGPNGAGKTTTIRCMMDFLRPTEGTIKILGKDAQREGVELKEDVGYLSGQIKLVNKWTGQEHIDFLNSLNGNKAVAKQLIERLQFDPTIKTKKLSSGNRQKLGIILALMTEPKVLMMDEPTNALDPLLQQVVYELIEEASANGTTIFMSSHNLAEIDRVCSRVGIIREGKMVSTESIVELRRKRLYTVSVFTDNEDGVKALAEKDGVDFMKKLPGGGHELSVKGDISSIMSDLQALKPKDLEIHHARLEDIFLEWYE